jgi:hypothetical protein
LKMGFAFTSSLFRIAPKNRIKEPTYNFIKIV